MVDVSRVVLAVDSRQVKTAAGALGQLDSSGKKAASTAQLLGRAMTAVGGALSVREIYRASEAWTTLNNRLRLVTDGTDGLIAAQRGVFQVAQQTRQPLEATAELYQRIAMNQAQLGLTGKGVVDITRTISQAMVVSGTSAQGAQAALVQLGQAFASGTLRGEELNSVLEQAPALAQAIARGMGVTVGQLRALGQEGELTADAVVKALQNQAEAVQDQFETMAPTIGQAITNVGNSMIALIGRMDEASGASATLAEGIMSLSESIDSMGVVPRGLLTLAAEFTDLGDVIGYNMARSTLAIDAFIAKNTFQFQRYAELTQQIKLMDQARLEQRASMEARLAQILDGANGQNTEYNDGLKLITVSARQLTKDQKLLGSATKQVADQQDRFAMAVEDSLDALYPGRRATRELQEEYRRLEEALKDGLIAQKDFDNWIEKNVLAEVTVTARRHVKDLQDEADPFAKAWEQAMERIDTAFADAWKGAFDSFSDFADGLKNAFKQLLAEMAHAAITRPILVSLGLVGGSSGAVAGTAGGAVSSAAGSLLSSVTSPITSKISSMLSPQLGNAYLGLTNTGYDIAGSLGLNVGDAGAFGIGSLATAGAGFAGSYIGTSLGSSLTGKQANSNIGSTIGSIGGAVIGGPIGAFIGGTIGGFLDSAFGSVGNKFASQTMNFATGAMKQRGGGQNLEGSQAIMEQLAAFNEAIGGSTAAVEVGIGDRTGFELRTGAAAGGRSRSERFKTAVEVLAAAMDEIIEKSTDLAEPVKQLALNFAGAEEDLARYTVALKGIWEMTERDPFTAAAEDIKTATENAAKTAMEVYREQVDALKVLTTEFDGSADAAVRLHDALAQTQAVSYQLGIIFEQVSQQVGSLFGGLRESIRTSMMSEAELYEFQRAQVLSLTEQLESLTDPESILATAQQIEKITASMWSGLDEFQRSQMGEEFLSYLDSTQALAEERLQKGMSEMEQSSKENNQLIQDGIRSAAVELQNSASMYSFSAQQMLDAAQMFFQASQQMMSGTMSEVNR